MTSYDGFADLERLGWTDDKISSGYVAMFSSASDLAIPSIVSEVTPGARVLDLCCGQANVSEALLQSGVSVVGADFSPKMLAYARERLPDGEFVALYDRDPASGCGLPYGFGFEHLGVTGWFRDACSGSTYDLTGACFGGPCQVGLNRLNVFMVDGEIIVDPADGPHGAFRSDNGDPVNPPQ